MILSFVCKGILIQDTQLAPFEKELIWGFKFITLSRIQHKQKSFLHILGAASHFLMAMTKSSTELIA